ncbi:MAG: substrate import-associated zinc metallohydrolase lipoprotein [Bacteroidota bacterium]
MKILNALLFALVFLISGSCYQEDPVDKEIIQVELSDDPLDQFIQTEFLDKYGIAVRYRFVDRYVDPANRVAPPRRELVREALDFLLEFWIEPYLQVENGEEFFKAHVPGEIVLIGSFIFNDDGTVTLGLAESGARITLTEVNNVDDTDPVWVIRQLRTIYHEFAHIVHQRYNLPANFQQISPRGYTSPGSWFTLTDEEALQRGYVSPYATSSFNEDYAETVAHILFDDDFFETFIDQADDCTDQACIERNEGRALIRQKFNTVIDHHTQNTGVDLLEVRARIQEKF